MGVFEHLMQDLGKIIGLNLQLDANLSCCLTFPSDRLSIQIDLDPNGDQILIGTQLGEIFPGPYRERIFIQAMRMNGGSYSPRGILAFSEKNSRFVLFQFLPLPSLNAEQLYQFIQTFCEHAKIWKDAVEKGEIPAMQLDLPSRDGS
ncbi:MAG: CesT family type III secretion system chaperone [Chlamydiales bacterium]